MRPTLLATASYRCMDELSNLPIKDGLRANGSTAGEHGSITSPTASFNERPISSY